MIVFAGPGVAGAIRNQFNQVTNTVVSGTDGDNFLSAEEKAYREAMKTVAQKEAKDWSLDEQKAAATDIAKNGTSSVVYAKAKAAMDAGTTWSVKLTNGKTMAYRIIGINHDNLADGSGKGGLTFEATSKDALASQGMNATYTNVGGWEQSELRQKMNSGEIWNLMPPEFQSKVKSVTKMTDNKGGGSDGILSATTDKLFLLSTTEIFGDVQTEGVQYEYYKSKGVSSSNYPEALAIISHWTRSVDPSNSKVFRIAQGKIGWQNYGAANPVTVFPAFCF